MTLIAAGTSRGKKLIRDLLPQKENSEDESVQTSYAHDVRHTRRETKEFSLREQLQTILNLLPGTIDNSGESSTNPEQRQQHNQTAEEEEEEANE